MHLKKQDYLGEHNHGMRTVAQISLETTNLALLGSDQARERAKKKFEDAIEQVSIFLTSFKIYDNNSILCAAGGGVL